MIFKPLFGSSPLGILFRILVLLVLPFQLFVASGTVHAVRATMTTHTAMLISVGEGLLSLGAMETPESGRDLIERMAATDPGMAGFGLARSDGQLMLVSRAPPGRSLPNLISDEQSRATFQEALDSGRIHAGRAYFFKTLSHWVIPIRVALRDAHGEVRAVMTAGNRIEGGTADRDRMSLGPGVNLLLMHDDGYRLYQHPLSGADRDALHQRAYGQPVEAALLDTLRALPEPSGILEATVEALQRAELAMYQAKAHWRNTLRFFDPKMQAVVNSRVAVEAVLREAIGTSQFLVYYQAQVNDRQEITGVEALLRWQHPRRGMVSPAEFIPLAEETGLILPIGNWVLESYCRQLVQWAAQPAMSHLMVAVNVSARQFHQRDFVDHVLDALARTGANPVRLKLELTESVLVTDVEGMIAKMGALKGRGVTFSLDDFGTGYSSLSYLKRLQLDQLKIDQGFVRDILIDANDAAIARMVVALADSLALTVIAEGMEIEAQREFLAGLGCRNYQGYLFSRPLPIQQLEDLVQGRRDRPGIFMPQFLRAERPRSARPPIAPRSKQRRVVTILRRLAK